MSGLPTPVQLADAYIAELRAENARLRDEMASEYAGLAVVAAQRINALNDEVDRLRAALESLRYEEHLPYCQLVAGPPLADDSMLPFKWRCNCPVTEWNARINALMEVPK